MSTRPPSPPTPSISPSPSPHRMSREESDMAAGHLPPPPPPPPLRPLEVEDLLNEILLRLPSMPCSLPCASVACKRWRRLVSHVGFFRRFRLHHRANPPLLGFFISNRIRRLLNFSPIMEAPNRVPADPFCLKSKDGSQILNCRHGLVLIFYGEEYRFLVWDPVTKDECFIRCPAELQSVSAARFNGAARISGAVLRPAGVDDFRVVLVTTYGPRAIAWVYSSETDRWSNLISTLLPPKDSAAGPPSMDLTKMPARLVGDSLYWILSDTRGLAEALDKAPCSNSTSILEFNLERQSLTAKRVPGYMNFTNENQISIIREKGGELGLITLSGCNAHFWKRNNECDGDGDTAWVLGRTIQLDTILPLDPQKDAGLMCITGFAEYNNVLLLSTSGYLFMVHLESLGCKIFQDVGFQYHAFESVYTTVTGIADGHDAADPPHDT